MPHFHSFLLLSCLPHSVCGSPQALSGPTGSRNSMCSGLLQIHHAGSHSIILLYSTELAFLGGPMTERYILFHQNIIFCFYFIVSDIMQEQNGENTIILQTRKQSVSKSLPKHTQQAELIQNK